MDQKSYNWYNSIVVKIIAMFFSIAIIVIAICGVGVYSIQRAEFEERCISQMRSVGLILKDDIESEGETFSQYQDYMLENSLEIEIPYDFGHEFVDQAEENFLRAFLKEYPGMIFGTDVSFEELSEEMKNLFCTFYHAKWFLYFEDLRDLLGFPYVYYVYPNGIGTHVVYIMDTERLYEGDEADNRLHLFDDYEEDYEELSYLFKTWEAGKMLDKMDSLDNEYGRNYSYYVPVYINDVKKGLVCIDMDINDVESNILNNVFKLVILSSAALVIGLLLLTFLFNRFYVSKLSKISAAVGDYSRDKNVASADRLEADLVGKDEISVVGHEIAGMMRNLDKYMKSLSITEKELETTKEAANRDALTGVKNRLSYNKELKNLQELIDGGETAIGLVMIDINYLKQINDTYGHERGNVSIKNLSRLICDVFDHSPVFRIGGDEFVVILKGRDYNNRKVLIEEFNERIEKLMEDNSLQPWEQVSAALGYAVYEAGADANIEDVFKRADEAMYERKKEMKSAKNT
ncbi:MAG: GGDEF domain-containing protein [Lachnospiraceae bacterium]|nr:GGDEF domain-containing protein [Lachnospiraceae bacterium]